MQRATLIFFLTLASPVAAQAADHCVSNEIELRAALAIGEQSPEADHVRVRAGTITLTQSLSFSSQTGPTGPLVVSGGWDVACANQQIGAQWTKIETATPLVSVGLSPDDDLTVRDLHFVNIPQGVGFSNQVQGPQLTTLRVSRIAVFNDEFVGDALSLFSLADRIEIDNLLVDSMAFCSVAAATFDDAGELTIRSSTLIARKNPDFPIGGNAICFDGAEAADLNAAVNAVFNSSEGIDIRVNGRPVVLQSSAYSDIEGCQPCGITNPLDPQSADNLVQPMAFDETATGNLARFVRVALSTLLIQSLIDSGSDQDLRLYPFDVVGFPRLAGASQDRGAFEVPNDEAIFFNGFED